MKRALSLAAQSSGQVAPNPMVGCVITQNGDTIGEGYHQCYGSAHAEINAIQSVTKKELLRGATLYVTLEPCNHFGKTPPCTKAIIESGISRVVFGCIDPNPLVAGAGIAALNAAGINTELSPLQHACLELNRRFIIFQKLKRPYIILKWAQTDDGFIARSDFSSKWISTDESRVLVHHWRSEEAAVLVGTNTALQDDPELTVRHVEGKNPLRLVIDREMKLPINLKLFDQSIATWVFNSKLQEDHSNLRYIKINFQDPFKDILSSLYNAKILSVLVEGGAKLLQSLIDAKLWDEARVFISPQRFSTGIAAPHLNAPIFETQVVDKDTLKIFRNRQLTELIGK